VTLSSPPSLTPLPHFASAAQQQQQQQQQQRSYATEDSELDAAAYDSDAESSADSRRAGPTAQHLTGGLEPFLQDALRLVMQPDLQEPEPSETQALIRRLLQEALEADGVDANVRLEYTLTKPGALLVTVDIYVKVGRITVVLEYDGPGHYMVAY
jgi:hypothetical protein